MKFLCNNFSFYLTGSLAFYKLTFVSKKCLKKEPVKIFIWYFSFQIYDNDVNIQRWGL